MLNLVASGSAAVSAYISWKQTQIAIDAVNITSRNEAFSEYLEAFTNVCKVSLVPEDQDDLGTFKANAESYEPARKMVFEIRELYEGSVRTPTNEQIDAFIFEASKRRELMWEKFTQLSIWLDEDAIKNLSQAGPDYSRFVIESTMMPAAYYAVEQQRRCRILADSAIALYKNPDDEAALARQATEIWVLPISRTKPTEEILKDWGREDVVETLTGRGLWPLPQ
jgi:hypothetical protein